MESVANDVLPSVVTINVTSPDGGGGNGSGEVIKSDGYILTNNHVISAAVGGGSLIYANISIEATPDTFEAGWPPEVRYQELAPHYAAVGRMMNVQPVPRGQWPARTSLTGTVTTPSPSTTKPQSISGFETRSHRPEMRTSVSRLVVE